MDASFIINPFSNSKINLKFSFFPNGELHVDLEVPIGFKSVGGVVYKCSNLYKNKIIITSETNSSSNGFTPINTNSTSTNSNNLSNIQSNIICNTVNEGKN